MTELGARLKEAREEKGYTLEEVQSLTKIQKRYLQGIEEGNYTMMPGSFYVRAFIKQYAEAVDLQPDELFESYASDIPTNHEESIPSNINRVKSRKSSGGSSKVFSFLPTVITVSFIVGIVFVIWLVMQGVMNDDSQADETLQEDSGSVGIEQPEENTSNEEDANSSDEENASNEDAADGDGEGSDETEEEPAEEELSIESIGVEGDTTTYRVSNTEEIEVTITSPETWIGITDQEGNNLVSEPLGEGSTITFDASDYDWFRIRVGRTVDTEIKINNEVVEFGIPENDRTTQNMIFEIEESS